MYIMICHMQMKIRLFCQNATRAGGHTKENLCVSDMFILCNVFLVVLVQSVVS